VTSTAHTGGAAVNLGVLALRFEVRKTVLARFGLLCCLR